MGRGILSGLIWGGVTGWVVVTVLSLYAPLADEKAAPTEPAETMSKVEPTPETSEPAEPEAAEPEPVATAAPETDVTEAGPEPEATQPDATGSEVAEVDPEAAETDDAEPEKAEVIAAPAPDVQVNAPQSADNQTDATGAQTQLPETDETVASAETAPLSSDAPETPVVELQLPDEPVRPAISTDAPTVPEATAAPKLASLSDDTSPEPSTPSGLSLPQVDAVPAASNEAPPRVSIAAQTQQGAVKVDPTPISSDTVIKLPVPKIENPVAGVVTNRLPSVTNPQAETEVVQEATPEASPAEAIADASEIGALKAYSAIVEGDVTDALFSIILIDDGANEVPRSELMNLAVPFSVAIDPAASNANAVAGEYRAAGVEVLAILDDLPSSAEPTDVAVAVEGYFSVLNEAIAVMDPLDGRIQSNRSLLQPILGAIRETGHGLVTYDRGLNTAQQAARREGIAAASVFRVLDGEQEQAPKIKRYLSRAAFNASKDGAVVVVGHARSETIKAILEWSLDEKGGELSIVPVSTVMQKDLG